MKEEWALHLKQLCEEQRIAFFFKQWGNWGSDGKKRSKKLNGRLLDGRIWDAYPQIQNLSRPPLDQVKNLSGASYEERYGTYS